MKISVIASVYHKYDAVSNQIRMQVETLERLGHEVVVYCVDSEYDQPNIFQAKNIFQILSSDHFQKSKVIFWHFAIYSWIFDVLLFSHHGKKFCFFHNYTPINFLPKKYETTINLTEQQMKLIDLSQRIYCDSLFNGKFLRDNFKIESSKIFTIPLFVNINNDDIATKSIDNVVSVTFIGRIIESKGVLDLLNAIQIAANEESHKQYDLTIVFNSKHSDADYLKLVQELIVKLKNTEMNLSIELLERISEQKKQKILEKTHILCIPSYHEGFCVPVVEALSFGCRVVTYDNSNFAYFPEKLVNKVPTGKVTKLADAILYVSNEMSSTLWKSELAFQYNLIAKEFTNLYSKKQVQKEYRDLLQ